MESAEETFYSDVPNNVYVTNQRLIVGEKTYYKRDITSSSTASIQDEAEVLLDMEYLGEETVINGLRLINEEEPEKRKKWAMAGKDPNKMRVGFFEGYALFISTSSSEEKAIRHLNKAEIDKISDALNYAIANRD